ncbi:sigma factor-like helix-turn-helix DNA-binding protein [Lentzea sp. NPDC005914]|uniref:sigma factor-like helix-turn-helix DNA-binding protein n=1 Tax=Lentzea sp. NPDC005914 TaxID=3154572 RepID=UPI0033D949EE
MSNQLTRLSWTSGHGRATRWRWRSCCDNQRNVASKVDLLDALDQLERRWPTVARALALRELADLEYTEIAAELGLPINTVKTFLHRGRHHLRELLTAHID